LRWKEKKRGKLLGAEKMQPNVGKYFYCTQGGGGFLKNQKEKPTDSSLGGGKPLVLRQGGKKGLRAGQTRAENETRIPAQGKKILNLEREAKFCGREGGGGNPGGRF